jgi:hypothetical protein
MKGQQMKEKSSIETALDPVHSGNSLLKEIEMYIEEGAVFLWTTSTSFSRVSKKEKKRKERNCV